MNIAVIGSGIGGLAAAVRLANKGHRITVFEKNPFPGGKISEIRGKGYRFDTGPSLFTLPDLLEELFEESKIESGNRLQYRVLENNCRYFFPDRSVFNFYRNEERLKQEVEKNTNDDFNNLLKRLKRSEELYNLSSGAFLFHSLYKLSNYASGTFLRLLCKIHKLDFGKTMHGVNHKHFKDSRMIQLFDRYATYLGSDPYRAPAILNMIAHLENNLGAYFPENGMYSIVESLYNLALGLGVVFEFNRLVDEIIIQNNKAVGIRAGGENRFFDRIISDVDIFYLANNMMRHPFLKRLNRQESSSSALVFYWGVNKTFSRLDTHNILFSADYREEFNKLFLEKSLSGDPTVYIFISSKIVESDAPANSENWYVMINAPAGKEHDTGEMIVKARKSIVRKIDQLLDIDITGHIEFEQYATPSIIEKNTLSRHGALYGSASNSMVSAFLRHPNFIRKIKNLYFAGGSVHPGGGIPLCLAGSKIISREIPPIT